MRGKTLLAAVIVVVIVVGFLIFSIKSPQIVGIEIEGGGRIGTPRIQALLGFQIGEPWNASFKDRAEAEMLGLSEVRHVSVSSRFVLPYGIKVKVDVMEREPFAVIRATDGNAYWVDSEGVVFSPASEQLHLPAIGEVLLQEDGSGQMNMSARLTHLLQDVFMMPGAILARFSEINIKPYEMEFVSRDGWIARVPSENVSVHLARLEKILDVIETEEVAGWTMIDLRFEGEATLR